MARFSFWLSEKTARQVKIHFKKYFIYSRDNLEQITVKAKKTGNKP